MSAIKLSFENLCDYLATPGGGYTLWIGAGAAMAATSGRMPSWGRLVSDLSQNMINLPANWPMLSFQAQLDRIASAMGHVAFRRALRQRIVDPVLREPLDVAVLLDQATIAARASVIVSFNIEMISAVPFAIAKGGGFFRPRPYLEGSKRFANMEGDVGAAMVPVYFPHGLLDMFGGCAITDSEYLLHKMSLAVDTAVNTCIGGDVLILGMSLADQYLRDAIVRGRRWMKNVLWVTNDDAFGEWARVAEVTMVSAPHEKVWHGIAQRCLDREAEAVARARSNKQELNQHRTVLGNGSMKNAIDTMRGLIQRVPSEVARLSTELVSGTHYGPKEFRDFVRAVEDLGLDVPAVVSQDPRYRPDDALAVRPV
ncbi:MAG: hypothetical protein M3O50_20610 [Myxococcota bacterium]|nr:hypothetical protein [Myxococcota bacterium]